MGRPMRQHFNVTGKPWAIDGRSMGQTHATVGVNRLVPNTTPLLSRSVVYLDTSPETDLGAGKTSNPMKNAYHGLGIQRIMFQHKTKKSIQTMFRLRAKG